jgi:hypothetical protein
MFKVAEMKSTMQKGGLIMCSCLAFAQPKEAGDQRRCFVRHPLLESDMSDK